MGKRMADKKTVKETNRKQVSPSIREETLELMLTVFPNPNAGALYWVEVWPVVLRSLLEGAAKAFTSAELALLHKTVVTELNYRAPGEGLSLRGLPPAIRDKWSTLTTAQQVALDQWAAAHPDSPVRGWLKPGKGK